MKDHSAHPFIGLIGGIFCIILGIYILRDPSKGQRETLDTYERRPEQERLDLFASYIKSPAYIRDQKVGGYGLIVVGLSLCVLTLLRIG